MLGGKYLKWPFNVVYYESHDVSFNSKKIYFCHLEKHPDSKGNPPPEYVAFFFFFFLPIHANSWPIRWLLGFIREIP